MSRAKRVDYKGAHQFLTNKAVGGRGFFEHGSEIRLFMSRIARMVRAGLIEVHSFVILPNHFHLLVKSLEGEISQVMRFIQDIYVQRFNWKRDRRGPLVQGRFHNAVVEDAVHFEAALRYITHNPVKAGLAADPLSYAFGSARFLAADKGPKWLTRELVDLALGGLVSAGGNRRDAFMKVYGSGLTASQERLVEGRVRGSRIESGPIELILGVEPERVLRFLRERARIADGVAPQFLVDRQVVLAHIDGRCIIPEERRVLTAGLLRTVCGLVYGEIAQILGVALSTARAEGRRHARRLADETYALLAAEIVERCVKAEYPRPRVPPVFGGGEAG